MPTAGSDGVNNQASNYVTSVTYTKTSDTIAVITALATAAVGGGITTSQGIALTGTAGGDGTVIWVCTPVGGIAPKYLPANCRN